MRYVIELNGKAIDQCDAITRAYQIARQLAKQFAGVRVVIVDTDARLQHAA